MNYRIYRFGMTMTALISVQLLISCVSTTSPVLYTDNPKKDFIILGEVTYSSNMFIPEVQKNGYTALLKAAKIKYPNCDYVIDLMIDKKTTLVFFMFPYANYVMRGTAIQYVKNNSKPSIETGFSNGSTLSDPGILSDNYTVVSIIGKVQFQRYSGDTWTDAKVNDILNKDFRIRTASDSSLELTDGNMTITIPGSVEGRLNSLAGMLKK